MASVEPLVLDGAEVHRHAVVGEADGHSLAEAIVSPEVEVRQAAVDVFGPRMQTHCIAPRSVMRSLIEYSPRRPNNGQGRGNVLRSRTRPSVAWLRDKVLSAM